MKMSLSMELDFSKMRLSDLESMVKYATWALNDKKAEIALMLRDGTLESKLRAEIMRDGKIAAIRLCRDLTGKGLIESKDLIDSL